MPFFHCSCPSHFYLIHEAFFTLSEMMSEDTFPHRAFGQRSSSFSLGLHNLINNSNNNNNTFPTLEDGFNGGRFSVIVKVTEHHLSGPPPPWQTLRILNGQKSSTETTKFVSFEKDKGSSFSPVFTVFTVQLVFLFQQRLPRQSSHLRGTVFCQLFAVREFKAKKKKTNGFHNPVFKYACLSVCLPHDILRSWSTPHNILFIDTF